MYTFDEQIIRTKMITSDKIVENLRNKKVLVIGLGGVGSFALEAIARAGIGNITICDHDTVSVSNINRQLPALHSTIGMSKAKVLANRVLDINPHVNLTVLEKYYTPENKNEIFIDNFDYIVDAIDSVTSKIDLIVTAKEKNIPIISALGTGNKFDPTKFEISDISKTTVCPLARVMRKELKSRGIYKHEVVFSTEVPKKPTQLDVIPDGKGNVPGSISFVPSVCGLILASHVINTFINENV